MVPFPLSFRQTRVEQACCCREGLNPSTWETEETEAVAMVRVQGIKELAFTATWQKERTDAIQRVILGLL